MLNIRFLADNELTRRMGLMNQPALQKDECALFEFPRTGKHHFWNKNVDFPISLIFCDEDNVVRDIGYLQAQQTKSVGPSAYNIKYVVEAHIDTPNILKVKKGKKFSVDGNRIRFNG